MQTFVQYISANLDHMAFTAANLLNLNSARVLKRTTGQIDHVEQ